MWADTQSWSTLFKLFDEIRTLNQPVEQRKASKAEISKFVKRKEVVDVNK